MAKYNVTLSLIIGYYDSEYENPKLRDANYEVEADSEKEAIAKAKEIDNTSFSLWEAYVEKTD